MARVFAEAIRTHAAVETIKMRAWLVPFGPSFITRYSHCLEGSTAVGSQQITQELPLPLPSKPEGKRTCFGKLYDLALNPLGRRTCSQGEIVSGGTGGSARLDDLVLFSDGLRGVFIDMHLLACDCGAAGWGTQRARD